MKALSLLQPWATLVVRGVKRYETRSWRTSYRGPLVIQASSRFPEELRALCERQPFRRLLREAGSASWFDLPLGALLGTVDVRDCLPVEQLAAIDGAQRSLGDYREGRWAWLLDDAQPFPEPIPWRGKRGIYEVPDGILFPSVVEASAGVFASASGSSAESLGL